MSIASAIENAQAKIAAAYTACSNKGATMPASADRNLSNLASTIASITTGGGSSRLVIGTFTTNSSSGAQNVTIPYTGSGYPIAAMVFVEGGASSANSSWYNLVQRYVVGFWAMHKSVQSTTPTYTTSGDNNKGHVLAMYKNSTSSATTYARTGDVGSATFNSSNAAATSANTCVRFKSATTMSVYVAASSYGLVPNLNYTYIIVYSS